MTAELINWELNDIIFYLDAELPTYWDSGNLDIPKALHMLKIAQVCPAGHTLRSGRITRNTQMAAAARNIKVVQAAITNAGNDASLLATAEPCACTDCTTAMLARILGPLLLAGNC